MLTNIRQKIKLEKTKGIMKKQGRKVERKEEIKEKSKYHRKRNISELGCTFYYCEFY
jgi:hypothetical protein